MNITSPHLAGYQIFLAQIENPEQNGDQTMVNGDLFVEVPEGEIQTKTSSSFTHSQEGALKLAGGKEYAFYPFSKTESATDGVFKFLKLVNHDQKHISKESSPLKSEKHLDHTQLSGAREYKESGKPLSKSSTQSSSKAFHSPTLNKTTVTVVKPLTHIPEKLDPFVRLLLKSMQTFKSAVAQHKSTASHSTPRETLLPREAKPLSIPINARETALLQHPSLREIPQGKPQHHEKERVKEDREGSGQHRDQQEEEEKDETQEKKDSKTDSIHAIDPTFIPLINKSGDDDPLPPDEIREYGLQESLLSEILGMRVSNFDVLLLFFEILKLAIKDRDSEIISRRVERLFQIEHMQSVVSNYQSQGKWLLTTTIMSGVLGIVSGVAPILGHMKGDWILEKLSGIFSSLKDMEKDKFFKGVMKMTQTMSEIQKGMGQVQQTFSEGNRTYDEQMGRIHETQKDERTRAIEDLKEQWKGIENFLLQMLQTQHDQIRQLYS